MEVKITFTTDELIKRCGKGIVELRNSLLKTYSEFACVDKSIREYFNRLILESAGVVDSKGKILIGLNLKGR